MRNSENFENRFKDLFYYFMIKFSLKTLIFKVLFSS